MEFSLARSDLAMSWDVKVAEMKVRGKGRHMQRYVRVAAALVGLAFVLAGAQPLLGADEKSSVEEIRKELLQLPYYGVFDFLAFSYDKGTVTLVGRLPLEPEARCGARREARVRRRSGDRPDRRAARFSV